MSLEPSFNLRRYLVSCSLVSPLITQHSLTNIRNFLKSGTLSKSKGWVKKKRGKKCLIGVGQISKFFCICTLSLFGLDSIPTTWYFICTFTITMIIHTQIILVSVYYFVYENHLNQILDNNLKGFWHDLISDVFKFCEKEDTFRHMMNATD